MFWESGGPWLKRADRDQYHLYDFANHQGILFGAVLDDSYVLSGAAELKQFLYVWSGPKLTSLRFLNNEGSRSGSPFADPGHHRAVNITNQYNEPFSLHPAIVLTSRCDGSVDRIFETLDAKVLAKLALRDSSSVRSSGR